MSVNIVHVRHCCIHLLTFKVLLKVCYLRQGRAVAYHILVFSLAVLAVHVVNTNFPRMET